jgi:hypothetical protein
MIHYYETLDLGFKRRDLGDAVWEKEYGYDWFITEKTIAKLKGRKRIVADWCPAERFITVGVVDEHGKYLNKHTCETVEEYKELTKILNTDK